MAEGKIAIAIDGPSGAGKSSIAKLAAAEFGLAYVDTGAIYRTAALAALRGGFTGDGLAEFLGGLDIGVEYDSDGHQRMLLDGGDVTALIRSDEVSREASRLSAFAGLRDFVNLTLREIARLHDVIMEGRDIGTVVLPDAGLKVFMTAAPEARARRRFLQLTESGVEADYGEVLRNLTERDEKDSQREVAPLRAADDAVLIDTTDMNFGESTEALFALIKERFSL